MDNCTIICTAIGVFLGFGLLVIAGLCTVLHRGQEWERYEDWLELTGKGGEE